MSDELEIAWKNNRILETARQEEMKKRDAAEAALTALTKERDETHADMYVMGEEKAVLTCQLAASQAREEKLREALELALIANGYGYDACRCAAALHIVQSAQQAIENALALPTDDTALKQRLAEERELCAKELEELADLYSPEDCAAAIRSMK